MTKKEQSNRIKYLNWLLFDEGYNGNDYDSLIRELEELESTRNKSNDLDEEDYIEF